MANWRVVMKKGGDYATFGKRFNLVITPSRERALQTIDAFCKHFRIEYEFGYSDDDFQQICYKGSKPGQHLLGYMQRE